MIIPVIAGCVSWLKFHTINLTEAGISTASALVVISMVLLISECSMDHDKETLSGRVTKACHTPEWHARWTELETYTTTDSKGRTRSHTRLVTKTRTYSPRWWVETTVGDFDIPQNSFKHIGDKHGIVTSLGYRPNFDYGDVNDYTSYVKDDPEFCDYPVTTVSSWRNPIKNAKSLYSFREISEEEAQKEGLYEYPIEHTLFNSSRLLGNPNVSIWNWDKMNSALGSRKKVNLILVKIDSFDKAKLLQNYWKNGKKNDIVICYNNTGNQPPDWCFVFGWSKSELVKLNLQTLLLDNTIDDSIIPKIKQIVDRDFFPHDWTMYKDTQKVIPTAWVVVAFILMVITQSCLYYVFHHEDIDFRNTKYH
jgi:hypothetical protein